MDQTRSTVRLCYAGMMVLALVINLAPPLFIPLKAQLGLGFEQLGRLVFINFLTQITFDLVCGPLADRFGAKFFAVAANLCAAVGLWLFALAPVLFPAHPYFGLALGTVVFSMGGGILELLLSPIVSAMPSDRKAADMNLLHSFYAIGQVVVVLGTALAIWRLGAAQWRWVAAAWSLLPLATAIGFMRVKIPRLVEERDRLKLRHLVRRRVFMVSVLAIGLAGASELVMSQWISAYAEKGLGFSKITGDLMGCCLFGAMLGLGRMWLGLKGEKLCMFSVMTWSCVALIGCYLVAGFSPWNGLALAACALAGLAAAALWPGMVSMTAARFPLAGVSMFAFLAASGDTGCALFPWLVGAAADSLSGTTAGGASGLKIGLLLAMICPLGLLLLLQWIRRQPAEA
jgi:fucose permease